jgi:hypothetical protein
VYGPVLPSKPEPIDDVDDDDDVIGPLPPASGESVDAQAALARQFEERARRMKDKLEGKCEDSGPQKREKWSEALS